MRKTLLLLFCLIFPLLDLYSFDMNKLEIIGQDKNIVVKLRAKKLIEAYEFVVSCSEKNERANYELIFFNLFPDTFKGMEDMFGFDDLKGEAPLYSDGRKYILYFSNLTSIKPDLYYKKYIDICIGGVWKADNITDGFLLHQRFFNDEENASREINKRSDNELKSAFKFVFDGPHPNNDSNKKINRDIGKALPNKYERLKKLINYSLENIIIERKHNN